MSEDLMEPMQQEPEIAPEEKPPHTAMVAGLLVAAALLVSWLGTYALSNALLAAELIAPWPAGQDPRLLWMLIGFVVLLGVFAAIGMVFRWRSGRELQSIDAMAEEE